MDIFDHISIKVRDARSLMAFYQAALTPLGIDQKFLAERPDGVVAGYGRERVSLFVSETDKESVTPIHIAFHADNRAQVDAFHAAGLAAGGKDNGAPGIRLKYHDGYYAAFVMDPAGNNLEAVFQD